LIYLFRIEREKNNGNGVGFERMTWMKKQALLMTKTASAVRMKRIVATEKAADVSSPL
jgi:hypothetical protein